MWCFKANPASLRGVTCPPAIQPVIDRDIRPNGSILLQKGYSPASFRLFASSVRFEMPSLV